MPINASGRNNIPFPVMRYTNKSGYGWIWDGGVGAGAGGGLGGGVGFVGESEGGSALSVGIIGIAARRHASQSLHSSGCDAHCLPP